MIPFFDRRRQAANRDVIDRLNEAVVAATCRPAFYLAGVPDTFNGRFEMLVFHTAMAVRRMRALPEPGPAMAQALVDTVFRNLDPAMRELGVGDMAVPKRMKRLAEAFLGRSMAYDRALMSADPGEFAATLSRNVYAGNQDGVVLAAYGRAAAALLDELALDALAKGTLPFPDPARFFPEGVAA